jgi:hypothetical protein
VTPVLKAKPGCRFDVIREAGFKILAALQATAESAHHDLVISAGTNDHHGDDPHATGEAYDVSIANLTPTELDGDLRFLRSVLSLAEFTVMYEIRTRDQAVIDPPPDVLLLINPEASGPHIHIQRRKGTRYPPAPPGVRV